MIARTIILVLCISVAVIALVVISYLVGLSQSKCDSKNQTLNNTYPLTAPISSLNSVKYRIGIISDLDKSSKSKNESNTWISYFKQGYLTYYPNTNNVTIEWDPEYSTKILKSHLSMEDRGLELSELVTYNGHLITVDEKTGMAYQIEGDKLIPWVVLDEGDGHQVKVQKNEWATVKDSKLYVGTVGHEFVKLNQTPSLLSMWVKVIDQNGGVEHLNWTENYIKVRAASGIHFPGYMVHESCVWSEVHGLWFFLPRKASFSPYDPSTYPVMCANILSTATADFGTTKMIHIGEKVPTHGYSSFKFIPGTNDTIIAAIKTMEVNDTTATFVTVFTIEGKIIYPETQVSEKKFEGFEFI